MRSTKADVFLPKRFMVLDLVESLVLFNGAFDYKPNRDGLYFLLNHINPLLADSQGFNYKLMICGRSIPEDAYFEQFYGDSAARKAAAFFK
jgi:hypothetical protein